jgi:hypothetical protein
MCAFVYELERQLGMGHHYTVVYAPWSNGAMERVNMDVLALTRIVLSETHLPTDEWPAFALGTQHAAINSASIFYSEFARNSAQYRPP